jgi:hypothetical protein
MPSRTILLKKINNGTLEKSCGFPRLFFVAERKWEIKGILIFLSHKSSLFHRVIHILFITTK